MEINKLKERAYRIAVNHGWYDEKPSLIHQIMLIMTELGEAINADRKGNHADREGFEFVSKTCKNLPYVQIFDQYIKDTVEDEFADAVIRILSMAGNDGVTLPEDVFSEEHLAEGVSVANEACTLEKLGREMTLPEELYVIAYNLIGALTQEGKMGDVLFDMLVIAKRHGIDIEWHIEQKMEYNELREYKHGNKKY